MLLIEKKDFPLTSGSIVSIEKLDIAMNISKNLSTQNVDGSISIYFYDSKGCSFSTTEVTIKDLEEKFIKLGTPNELAKTKALQVFNSLYNAEKKDLLVQFQELGNLYDYSVISFE